MPGPWRPARPARCVAEAWEIRVEVQAIHAAIGIKGGNACEAGVDDGSNAVDGERSLGDVGGEDDFSFAVGVGAQCALVVRRRRGCRGGGGVECGMRNAEC